jgi:transcriptional regulator with XRE-family HTH domain
VSRQESAERPDVGGQIRKARDAAGISQVELAIRLRCGERTVQAWERNERTPRIDALGALAAELGQSVAYFYGSDAPEPIDEPNGVAA